MPLGTTSSWESECASRTVIFMAIPAPKLVWGRTVQTILTAVPQEMLGTDCSTAGFCKIQKPLGSLGFQPMHDFSP